MAGFLPEVAEALRVEVARFRQRPFLRAAMAGSALVAVADGDVSFSERSRLDQVLEKVEALRLYESHEAIDLFNAHVDAIVEDAAEGREAALEIVAGVADDAEAAALILRICVALAGADGETSANERLALDEIAARLGLEPAG